MALLWERRGLVVGQEVRSVESIPFLEEVLREGQMGCRIHAQGMHRRVEDILAKALVGVRHGALVWVVCGRVRLDQLLPQSVDVVVLVAEIQRCRRFRLWACSLMLASEMMGHQTHPQARPCWRRWRSC